MKRNARLLAVMLGLGVAGGAWAAVRTQKTVGPEIEAAVKTKKTVGPAVLNAVKTQKAVTQDEKRAGHAPLLDLNAGL